MRDYVRGRLRAMGLPLLAADAVASRTVTAFAVPDARPILAALRRQGIELAGGQGPLEGRLIRIGHVGWATEADMREVLDRLAEVLAA